MSRLVDASADFILIHLTKPSGAAVEADALPTFRVYGQAGLVGDGTAEYLETKTITGGTAATPIVFTTSAAHGLVPGMMVTVSGVNGLTGADGTRRVEEVPSATTFSHEGSVGGAAYTNGGQARPTGLYKLPFDAALRAGLEVGKTYLCTVYYQVSAADKADDIPFTVVA
jgi:hypothetical protein